MTPGFRGVTGVEELFDLFEGVQDLFAVHLLKELGAGEAIAVLAGYGSTKLHDEVSDLFSYLTNMPHALGLAGIHSRAYVERAHAGVAVETGPSIVPVEYLLETAGELLQPVCRNGGVFYESNGFRLVRRTEQQRQDGLTELYRLSHLLFAPERSDGGCPDFFP